MCILYKMFKRLLFTENAEQETRTACYRFRVPTSCSDTYSEVWMNCFLVVKGERLLLGSGFLGTELPGKGRNHRGEAADGSWACPVTITERKCDGLSGFYQA